MPTGKTQKFRKSRTPRNTTMPNKATKIGWARAKALAKGANIPNNQARTHIAAVKRETPEHLPDLYDYLDNKPTFRCHYGKALIQEAQAAAPHGRASNKNRTKATRATTKTRRPSQGNPTRPVRHGAPNEFGTDKTELSMDLLMSIRGLEKQYSNEQVREGIQLLDQLRAD